MNVAAACAVSRACGIASKVRAKVTIKIHFLCSPALKGTKMFDPDGCVRAAVGVVCQGVEGRCLMPYAFTRFR